MIKNNTKEVNLGGFFMSGALMNKVWNMFGMDTAEQEEYEDEDIYEYEDEDEMDTEDRKFFGKKNKIVSMPQQQAQTNAIKMVISQPTAFEQSDEICSFLKERKSVIVNLEYVNKDVQHLVVRQCDRLRLRCGQGIFCFGHLGISLRCGFI